MADENPLNQPATAQTTDTPRGKSTIEFPYLDLDNSIEIVKAIHKVEGDRCEWNQLATSLGVSAEGGGFRMRLLTAKTFGLLTYERGQIMLTDCGILATDPAYEKRARYEAFINVPLFKMLFERFNGQPLPPPAGLERAIENLGVAPKQKDKARQVFQRSAKQAGLFELASDRLSIPPGLGSPSREKIPDDVDGGEKKGSPNNGNSAEEKKELHPFIVGLLDKLPTPETRWSLKDRAKWLQTASNIFDLMYSAEGEGEITVAYKIGARNNEEEL